MKKTHDTRTHAYNGRNVFKPLIASSLALVLGVSVASADFLGPARVSVTLEATTGNQGEVSVIGGEWQITLPPGSPTWFSSYIPRTDIIFNGATNLIFVGDGGSHNSYEVGSVTTTQAGKITINSENASTTTIITGTISGAGGLSVAFLGINSGNLVLHDASNTLASVNATNDGTLTLGDGTNKADTIVKSITGEKLSVVYGATQASNLTLHGASNTLASVDATNAGTLTLGDGTNKADATIASITGNKLSVVFANTTTNTGTLVLKGTQNTLASIAGSGTIELGGSSTALNVTRLDGADNLTFNLAGNVAERFPASPEARTNLQTRTVTISDYQSTVNNSFVLLATATKVADGNKAYASYDAATNKGTPASAGGSDKIVITANGSGKSNNTISLVMKDGDRITDEDRYVVLAEVSGSNKENVTFNGGTGGVAVDSGFATVSFDLKRITNEKNKTDYVYTNLASLNIQGVSINTDFVAPTTAALSAGVSVFSANLNSLSKRMGELRNDPYANGVWARVFAGEQTTNFGAKQSTVYSTFQAGYDYKLALQDASNYIGLALSYIKGAGGQVNPVRKMAPAPLNRPIAGLTSSNTNGVEVALYNSYIANSGLYSDSIVKFGYYMTDLAMFGQTDTYSTSNLALAVSEEIGYKVKLGESNEWFITPQGEVAFAYIGGTKFTQNLGGETMKSTQDATSLLRTRVGAAWGYDFSHLAKESDIKASIYLGTYYTYDYFIGGDTTLSTAVAGKTTDYKYNAYEGTGRFVMNLGTNIDIKDSTKVYVDFEKSFGGSIQTNYQISLGVRFGFGEKVSALKLEEKKSSKAILKPKELDENVAE